MNQFALQARWVVPVDSPPIEGGVVTIEDDRILALGTQAENNATVDDLGDVVLLPGWVNAHTHLEFSQLARPLGHGGMSLPEWIQLVIASRKQPSNPATGVPATGVPATGVIDGLRESLRNGVTTLGEIATGAVPFDLPDALPNLVAFQEVIGFSAARVESVFAELTQRLEATSTKHRQIGVSPHAPYTVHPLLLERIVALANSRHLPVAMHLAESPEELQLLRENAGPFRELLEARSMWDSAVFVNGLAPLDYLQVLAQAPRALVVHGNYLSPNEIEFVSQRRDRMAIIYCPRTHAYFGHADYPLQAMLDTGVCLAIGTDSRASNPDLSLLSELRCLANTYPQVPPSQIVRLGTLCGAEALGLTNLVGSLTPGKLANLTAIACDPSEQSPWPAVLFGEKAPVQTWLRGQPVV